jgi:hypothetical protein
MYDTELWNCINKSILYRLTWGILTINKYFLCARKQRGLMILILQFLKSAGFIGQ